MHTKQSSQGSAPAATSARHFNTVLRSARRGSANAAPKGLQASTAGNVGCKGVEKPHYDIGVLVGNLVDGAVGLAGHGIGNGLGDVAGLQHRVLGRRAELGERRSVSVVQKQLGRYITRLNVCDLDAEWGEFYP